MKCPCCGQEAPNAPFMLDASSDSIGDGRLIIHLGPIKFKIVQTLLRRPGGWKIRDLVDQVYADDIRGGPDVADVTIRTHIWKLKRQLAPFGLKIINTRGPGSIYKAEYVARS